MSAPNSALALTATGIAAAVAAFCASVVFMTHYGPRNQTEEPATQVYALDALSISVRIAKEAKTPEEAEFYYKELEAMMADLRQSGLFVVDSRFVIASPSDRVIGADRFFERIQNKKQAQKPAAGK